MPHSSDPPVGNWYAKVYLAKQLARGTPASTPTFAHAVTGGAVITAEEEVAQLEASTTVRMRIGAWRQRIEPRVDLECYPTPKAVGLWLLAALGGYTVQGSGPYTHTFTPSPLGLPYLTVWDERLPAGAERAKATDVRVTNLELSWDGTSPARLKVDGVALGLQLTGVTVGTPTHDETVVTDLFGPLGGEFRLDPVGSSPVTASVTQGSLKVTTGAEALYVADSVTPADAPAKLCEVELSLTLVPDDFAEWRELLKGAGSGDVGSALGYGAASAELVTPSGASLAVTLPRCKWAADLPEVAPAGDPVTLEMSAVAYAAASADLPALTLTNDVASY
jgi:hypothetical protein